MTEAQKMLTPDEAWHELIEKDDRNSPEKYPDHCLISFEELQDFMSRSRGISGNNVAPSLHETGVSDEDWNRALGCAYSCLEAPYISLADFDNAMQHAFGILDLRRRSPAVSNGDRAT